MRMTTRTPAPITSVMLVGLLASLGFRPFTRDVPRVNPAA